VNHSAIARAKLQVDTRKWIMSKMAPKKYGEKIQQELTGPDGKPLPAGQTTVVVADLQTKSLDELTKLFTEKLKG
jgi:acyl-CoA thioesterase FadM